MSKSLTREKLMEFVTYDPVTGIFRHKISRGRASAGKIAGASTGHGYRKVTIEYERHYEHHLAWLYTHGEYPDTLDHIDGNRSNNVISNLRIASRTQNRHNSKRSESPGAYFDKRVGRWYSKIQIGSFTQWLGYFKDAETASAAFRIASLRVHGQFSVANRPTPIEERC